MKTPSYIKLIPIIASLLVAVPAHADSLTGLVVGVTDGDTVTVLDDSSTQRKIRLMGIDAPEKNQAFGQKSKQHLSDLVYNKQVTVEYSKNDRYGRTIGKILVNGIDANLKQIKAGFAWHYKKYLKEQTPADRSLYSEAEEQARAGHNGLWSDPEPTPPWCWRHQRQQDGQCE